MFILCPISSIMVENNLCLLAVLCCPQKAIICICDSKRNCRVYLLDFYSLQYNFNYILASYFKCYHQLPNVLNTSILWFFIFKDVNAANSPTIPIICLHFLLTCSIFLVEKSFIFVYFVLILFVWFFSLLYLFAPLLHYRCCYIHVCIS